MKLSFLALGALALVGCAAVNGDDAESSSADLVQQKTMMSIGDSIAFAWDPTVPEENGHVIASRYRGYPDLVGAQLGLRVVNTACPGETSGSFLDKNAEDNGCRKNRESYALHSDWKGANTQMEIVLRNLEESIGAGNAPELITFSIGGNDLLLIQKHCDGWGFATPGCEVVKLPFGEHDYGSHLEQIFKRIDAAGFRGTMVVVTTHAPDYSDWVANIALGRFNGEIRESVRHVEKDLHMKLRVADGFEAFKAKAEAHGGKTCETGLLVKNPDGTCDIHPSLEGHKVLAAEIAKVAAQ